MEPNNLFSVHAYPSNLKSTTLAQVEQHVTVTNQAAANNARNERAPHEHREWQARDDHRMWWRGAVGRTLRHARTRARPRMLSTKRDEKKRIWERADVDAAAAARKRHEMALANARWASSWMMPWERAQMDSPTRPLKLWERVYWRLFIVFGGVGIVYETWVLGNRRVWREDKITEECVGERGLYRGTACLSTRLLSDEDLKALGINQD